MTLIEQSADGDDLQPEPPETGDFCFLHSSSHRAALVYWWDCPLSPGSNAELFCNGAKRNSRTQKQWIQTWNECSCERIQLTDMEKALNTFVKSLSKSAAGCLSVMPFFLTWIKNRELMLCYHFPPTRPLLHLPKHLIEYASKEESLLFFSEEYK